MEKQLWEAKVEEIITEYLTRNDGRFDDVMNAKLAGYNYEEESISVECESMEWQRNERGGIHGGAIAGMFDTAFGVVANFVAGRNEAATADMSITYIRPIEFGQHTVIKVYIVRGGRTMIRLRAEMFCKETGKLVATGSGTWIPL